MPVLEFLPIRNHPFSTGGGPEVPAHFVGPANIEEHTIGFGKNAPGVTGYYNTTSVVSTSGTHGEVFLFHAKIVWIMARSTNQASAVVELRTQGLPIYTAPSSLWNGFPRTIDVDLDSGSPLAVFSSGSTAPDFPMVLLGIRHRSS